MTNNPQARVAERRQRVSTMLRRNFAQFCDAAWQQYFTEIFWRPYLKSGEPQGNLMKEALLAVSAEMAKERKRA